MIVNTSLRQRQQHERIHSYHLFLSLILLLLTVYPYLFNTSNICCSVAAYSAEDLELQHRYLDKFDILTIDDVILSKSISTRSVTKQLLHTNNYHPKDASNKKYPNEQQNAINSQDEKQVKKVQFSSLGRRFNLVLSQPTHLLADDFTITLLDGYGNKTEVPFNRDSLRVMEGHLDEDEEAKVTASFNDKNKLLTAQIKLNDDTIIVEPTYLHKDNLQNSATSTSTFSSANAKLYSHTMIVYNLRDHKQFQLSNVDSDSKNEFKFNPHKLCGAVSVSAENNNNSNDTTRGSTSLDDDIFKTYARPKSRNKRGIEFTYEQSRDKTRCTLHLVADYLFYKHVGNGDYQTTINYLLALINRVNQIYLPTVWDTGDDRFESFNNIGFTVKNLTIHQEYTQLSSGDVHYNMQSDKVWTAREFLDNFSRNSPPKPFCLAHLLTYRQFDSPVLGLAYVASTRFGTIGGICSPVQYKGDAVYKHNTGISTSKGILGETLITRQADLVLAHELGHNLGAEHDSNDCRPSPSQGGAYLMHPFAVMGFEKNNRFLSNCSRLAIGRVIHRKASTCFVGVMNNICGNGVVEEDEECDGGNIGHEQKDPCCDSSCRFTPGSQCSDRHSWCCSKCRIVPAGRPCRPAEEYNCKQASYCDGRSAECPAPPPVEDDKVCVGRGLCRGGQCIPFCEARELYSCLCNTPANACKLCCKQSLNGTCVPYDDKAPYLPDGVLCYRGVCEKGRCEQPIQDVIERLWDVIEDINLTTFVKFLRDNIILVVLVASIPIWCVITHYINEFDKHIKRDVISAIMKNSRRRKGPHGRSPFLPRLFVGDEASTASMNDVYNNKDNESLQPLKQPTNPDQKSTNNSNKHFAHTVGIGFRPPDFGFNLPHGEEVVVEPRSSIAMNSVELPHGEQPEMNKSIENLEAGLNLENGSVEDVFSTQV